MPSGKSPCLSPRYGLHAMPEAGNAHIQVSHYAALGNASEQRSCEPERHAAAHRTAKQNEWLVARLLNHGADIEDKDHEGKTRSIMQQRSAPVEDRISCRRRHHDVAVSTGRNREKS